MTYTIEVVTEEGVFVLELEGEWPEVQKECLNLMTVPGVISASWLPVKEKVTRHELMERLLDAGYPV